MVVTAVVQMMVVVVEEEEEKGRDGRQRQAAHSCTQRARESGSEPDKWFRKIGQSHLPPKSAPQNAVISKREEEKGEAQEATGEVRCRRRNSNSTGPVILESVVAPDNRQVRHLARKGHHLSALVRVRVSH